jgi:acetylornithine deacetylase/succinyl-diaminopimelate desuccinylase-like protein
MGLEGLPLLITEFFTPTANIIGFNGGYTGEGYKPLLMSGGSVKVDFRLVPDQQPDEILELLKKHLNRRGFTDIEVEQVGDSESPARTSPNHPFVQTALLSMEHATRQPPLVVPLGPTVGPMKAFKQYLNDLPIICAGTYYDGAMPDTPDENIRVSDFFNHMKFTTRLLGQMAENAAVISPGSSSAPENTVKPEG